MAFIPIILALTVLSGCARPVMYPGRQDYTTRGSVVKQENYHEESAHYRSSNVLISPNDRDRDTASIKYLESKKSGKQRFVIILPIYGSVEFIAAAMASRLTDLNENADFNVAVIKERGDLFDWDALAECRTEKEFRILLNESAKRFWMAVKEVQDVIDWAHKQPTIDTDKIGIVGFSLGGMVAAYAMGIDGRISAGAFVMSGGDPHEIFAYSEVGFIKKVRKNALKRFIKTPAEFKNIVEEILSPINPNQFAQGIPPEKVLIFEAKFDTYIPQSSRENFWKAFHKKSQVPLRVTFPHGHMMSFRYITPFWRNFMDINIAAFLRKTLK